MNKLPLIITLLAGAFLASITSVFGSTVTTTPVGYITKSVNASADLKLALPFKQSSALTGSVGSVSSGTITVSTTVPDITTSVHYLWITSGVLEGNWYQVIGSDASGTISVTEDLENAGLLASSTFDVIPVWTLNTLFVDGAGFPGSSDVFAAVAFVALNSVTATGTNLAPDALYFYHDGTQGDAGWYKNGALEEGLQNDVIISPGSYITVRNGTSSAIDITVAGTVPSSSVGNDVVQFASNVQDNQIANPFPVAMTLSAANLVGGGVVTPSPDVFAPIDLLLVYSVTPSGYNPAPDKTLFYHDGTQGDAGWYVNGALEQGLQDNFEIPAGAAIIVRKASGADSNGTWTPTLPYTL